MIQKLRRKLKRLFGLRVRHYDYRHVSVTNQQIAPGWVATVQVFSDDPFGTAEVTDTEFDLRTHEWDVDYDLDVDGDSLAITGISQMDLPEASEEVETRD